MEVVMDAFFGGPTVGNSSFEVASIRGVPSLPVFPLADFAVSPTPLNLGIYGLPATCSTHLVAPVSIGAIFADPRGIARLPVPIPVSPAFVSLSLAFQFLVFDPNLTSVLPYVATNVLQLTIQP